MTRGIEYPYVIERVEDIPHEDIAYNKAALESVLTNIYWVGRLAFALEVIISHAETLDEAQAIAKDHLGKLVDPMNGLRTGIPEEIRLRWRVASMNAESRNSNTSRTGGENERRSR